MSEEQKIQKIKDRISDLMTSNKEQMKEIRESCGTNNLGYATYVGGCDDLYTILSEIKSGEIYED